LSDRKRIAHATADNAHSVMALLCTWAVHPDGPQNAHPLRVVVLVEPEILLDARALMDTLDRYAPDTARWVYRRGANPALRALVERDVPAASPVQQSVFTPPQRGPSRDLALSNIPLPRPERRPLPPARPALRLTDHPAPAPDDALGDLNPPDARVGARAGERIEGPSSVLTDEELAMLLGDNPHHDAPRKRRRKGEGDPE
jgi:hypothetical protein